MVVVPVEDEPGAAAGVFQRIANAHINVRYTYLATGNRLVIAAGDPQAVINALRHWRHHERLNFARLRDTQLLWDAHAAADPLWAVLAFPEKRGGRWTLQEFMKTGEREIALLFHRFAELQLPAPRGRALDFGCGVGRLTQALARRMERVVGADISPVMIDLARRLNRYADRVEYICTARDTGSKRCRRASFQCIYSNIVLQHVPAGRCRFATFGEFFRLLGPDGLLVFQLPSHRESPVEAEIKPMPDAAYRAAIELAGAGAGHRCGFRGARADAHGAKRERPWWQQPHVGPLAVGNHWLDAAGELMLLQDDGTIAVAAGRAPGLGVAGAVDDAGTERAGHVRRAKSIWCTRASAGSGTRVRRRCASRST